MSSPQTPRSIPEAYKLPVDKLPVPPSMSPQDKRKLTAGINVARSIGMFTFADTLALGKDRLQELKLRKRGIPEVSIELFQAIAEKFIECEIPQQSASPEQWPGLYRDFGNASIATLLPATSPDYHFPTYRSLDFGNGETTVGTFLRSDFTDIAITGVRDSMMGPVKLPQDQTQRLIDMATHVDGLIVFREDVVLPAVEQFNQARAAGQ